MRHSLSNGAVGAAFVERLGVAQIIKCCGRDKTGRGQKFVAIFDHDCVYVGRQSVFRDGVPCIRQLR